MSDEKQINSNASSPLANNGDLYKMCVDSLISQIKEKYADQTVNYDDMESEMYKRLFANSLNHAVSNLDSEEDKVFLESYKITESADELLNKISLEASTNPRFSQFLLNGIIQDYVNLALEYKVIANPDIISSIQQ